MSRSERLDSPAGTEIAIVGMACRFPKARNPAEFWHNLRSGRECISFFSVEEVKRSGVAASTARRPNFVRAGGALEDIEYFDNEFFGFSPREAEVTDPQHRFFLECSWEALEKAGYDPATYSGLIGVYAGVGMNTYLFNLYLSPQGRRAMQQAGDFRTTLGNGKDHLPTWVSYALDLRGPSVNVNTACSTGLVAVHIAAQSLLAGECDMALAGGVTIDAQHRSGYLYQEGGIESPDGHCRAFDHEARGTVGASGVGVVVLKRLSEAVADGDRVLAVLRGSAINNDGCLKAGYTAPSVEGQSRVIREALAVADVDPATISFVEAHGTATQIGDPIEIRALTEAYREFTDRRGYCAIGSVKSNLGHLDTAAGVAGLIKAVLALQHGEIPPTLHYRKPNPQIPFETTPFFVNPSLLPWATNGVSRRAGVSSFGMGGTNAHAIVEEPPPLPATGPSRPVQLLTLSARTAAALETGTEALAAHLEEQPDADLADAAFTLHVGRRAFAHRRAVLCRDREDAVAALRSREPERTITQAVEAQDRPVAFLFPGQGAQFAGMGRDLYAAEPTFRELVDLGAELAAPLLGLDLRRLVSPEEAESEDAGRRLTETSVAQPALFVVEYALARLWMEWGVEPEAMIGHSLGEYVAACVAGVFDFETGLRLVTARGRLMQALPAGAMTAVHLNRAELEALLEPPLCLAAVNAPGLCVATGPSEAIEVLEGRLVEQGARSRRLHTSHAFHSPMMDPILEELREELSRVSLSAPSIPFVSCRTGAWIEARQATDPDYWVGQARDPVLFAQGLAALLSDPLRMLLEVGPGRTLASFARQATGPGSERWIATSMRHARDRGSDLDAALRAAGRLWAAGNRLDWHGFHRHERRRRADLPTYPFERKRFWFDRDFSDLRRSADGDGVAAEALSVEVEEAPAPEVAPALRGVAGRVVEVWREVLGLEAIAETDDFFEIGGHSLLLIEVVSRLREEFAVDLPMLHVVEAPTPRGVAALIEEAGVGTGEVAPLPEVMADAARRHEPFPLTEVQEAYWIGRSGSLELGNVATHEYSELETVDLDLDRLHAALDRIVERHEMLRAVVLPDGTQRILEEVPPYRPPFLDLRGMPAQRADEALAAIRAELSHQVLPADRWPLFDIRIVRLDERRYRVHLSLDMLIADAWSIRILHDEIVRMYLDPAAELRPIDLSFRDYVLTAARFQQSEQYRLSREYWRARLDTLPGPPELPLARDVATLGTPRFARLQTAIERRVWGRLKARGSAAGLMPSGVLLAAFAAVIAAWSKNPRFLLNLTLFNRLPLHPHVDRVVGDFTSLTLVEVDRAGVGSFEEWSRRIQDRLLQDLEHRFVSGIQVLRELMQRRGRGTAALAPVVFTSTLFMSAGEDGRSAGGDEEEDEAPPRGGDHGISQTPQVWLDLGVGDQDGHLMLSWDVVEALFPAGMLEEMLEAYTLLLRRLADDDAAWRSEIPSLAPSAQLAFRARVNATEAPVAADLLHELFDVAAQEAPDRPAVITPETTLSYGELQGMANRIGRRLRELGARPNQLVAVVMEKGWEQVAAVLGVLRSGAAYLPVDPSVPAERLEYLLRHGEAEIALTQPWLEQGLAWPSGVRRVALRSGWGREIPEEPLERVQGPEDLAYVIFTSGSTGLPKGVMIDHRGAVNTVLDVNRRLDVQPDDRVLALSSLSFDLSVYDVFGLLAAGAALVMPDRSGLREPAHWAELLERHRVSVWNSVPALLSMLADFLGGRSTPPASDLRHVLLSGDWIPLNLPPRIRERWPGARTTSLGGATEASIWSILFPIEEVDPAWASVPYGKPMGNQTFHVLDGTLEPRPVWVPGDLYIGGIGLARGYWRDEEKTAASFVRHPKTGERLYRTGDLGRYLPDGNIEFLGREDFQVKIQGHRIELGEIEAALLEHPATAAAVVAAMGEERGEKRLVAYVVPEGAPAPRAAAPPPPAAPQGGVIEDPIRRMEFKTEQRGIRRLSGPALELLSRSGALEPVERLAPFRDRRSHRRFLDRSIPNERFGELLAALRREELDGRTKYRYPSAGSLYPVQTYVYVKQGVVGDVPKGTYYYHPGDHRLAPLAADAELGRELFGAQNGPVFERAAFAIFLVADHEAIAPLYGDRSRDFCLLEAGYMAQLLMTVAPSVELGLCPIGGLDFERVAPLLDLGPSHEFLHALVGGAVDPAWAVEGDGTDDEYRLFLDLLGREAGRPGVAAGIAGALAAAPPAAAVTVDTERLREFLAGKLPAYMIPHSFMVLDALPLTANGKVDRRALPRPEPEAPPPDRAVAPRTGDEAEVAALWAEVLGRDAVGVEEDFFELGGHSLLAARLIARVRERFEVELTLGSLFERPTVAAMASRIAELGGGAPRVGDGGVGATPGVELVLEPEALHEPFPLTDLQQGYWIGSTGLFELGGIVPHFFLEFEVQDLDVARLERALERLVARHPMLRAVVQEDGRQRVLETVPAPAVGRVDLGGLSAAGQRAALATSSRDLSLGLADLARWPQFALRVCRLGEGRDRLQVAVSLLICDAWSAGILGEDLRRFYRNDAPPPPLALTFRDYVLAMERHRRSDAYARALAYWRGRLEDLPPAPELPLAHRPSDAFHPGFVRRTGRIDPEDWRRFRERAAAAGVTLDAALATAYAEVLGRWSKVPQLTLNVLYFSRQPIHPDVASVLGNFSSTLLLAVDTAGGGSFEARARRLQERLWQDLEHGEVSGLRVLRELGRSLGAGSPPLMPVVFASTLGLDRPVAAASVAGSEAAGTLGRLVDSRLETPQVWLDHQVHEDAGGLSFNWDAVEGLFPGGLVAEMFAAYVRLLGYLTAEEASWSAPPVDLLPAEQLVLRAEANATERTVPTGLLHEAVAAHAVARPGAPAVVAAGRTLTFAELDREAEALSRRLRALGVQPDRLVAVAMEKGWEQVVAVVGVLRSGAAYLPVAPGLPEERRALLLDQGEAEVVVTQPALAEGLEWPAGVRVVVVEAPADGADGALEASERAAPVQGPGDLAYVIFTSGSTGLPKGVMIDHRGALNTVLEVNRRFGVGPEDRVLSLSSLSFDLSVYDVFGLLAAGGAVVQPEPEALREPAAWAARLEREGVTVWNTVPALMEMLVDHLSSRGERLPASLRLVLLSGDWIPVALPERIRALGDGVEVVGLGGATEASIWSILHPVERVDPSWKSIPYGRPLANQRFHVLDRSLAPCPVWVTGELYIGGVGLARGYWRDERRTAASFIRHPASGERLYRTGDLGRYLPEGEIEFLGREDNQVKVQGYRIELGEIEAALAAHPEVAACVVVAVGEARGSKRLVAYVVPAPGQRPAAEALRRHLAALLPEYMVPASFVALEELPLTSNGKVDRGSLRAAGGHRTPGEEQVAPRDELEFELARLWEEVLEVSPVSATTSFVEAGGHSLLAVRLVARIRERLGHDLPLTALLEADTVEKLAARLRQGASEHRRPLVAILGTGSEPPYFWVHPVGGNVFCYLDLSRRLGTDRPFYGLQAPEAEDRGGRTVEELAACYLEEVRSVQADGPYHLGGWSMGGVIAFEMALQLQRGGQPAGTLSLVDADLPGRLGARPGRGEPELLAGYYADLASSAGRGVELSPRALAEAPDPLLLVWERAVADALLPGDVDVETVRRLFELYRANLEALVRYRPGAAFDGEAVLYRASDGWPPGIPEDLGWGEWVERLRVVALPGDHYGALRAPALEVLAERLRETGGEP